ncbi:MAG TPA: diacylglycerol kinase family protein, partial [Candidatus Dormibacteraeota bacterium]|nr:diacylglycerol kinase family protein [Candidatus Dormibacteraeota bacterium]
LDKLLILSSKAGSMSPEVESKLRKAYADYQIVEFDPRMKLLKMLAPHASVVVAGGDGTVAWVTTALIDTQHTLGILGLGTFNNFAASVGMPKDLNRAIKATREGVPIPVTIGRINGHPFLEVAAIGMFGEALQLGEAAKDMVFGKLSQHFAELARSEPFEYHLSGDIEGNGVALSLVFANTPSTGARLTIASDTSPIDPHLELQVHAGESYRDLLKRMVRSAVGSGDGKKDMGMTFKFRHLRVETRPRARAFADSSTAGRTPLTIDADVGGLRLILPAAELSKRRQSGGPKAK